MTEQPSPEQYLFDASNDVRRAFDRLHDGKANPSPSLVAVVQAVEHITMALGRPAVPGRSHEPTPPVSATHLPWKVDAAAAVDSMMLDRDAAIEDRDNARHDLAQALAERDQARDDLARVATEREELRDHCDHLAKQHADMQEKLAAAEADRVRWAETVDSLEEEVAIVRAIADHASRDSDKAARGHVIRVYGPDGLYRWRCLTCGAEGCCRSARNCRVNAHKHCGTCPGDES